MKKNFFAGLTTPAEINAVYKTLAFHLHPDNGGSSELMAELNSQRKAALSECSEQPILCLPEHCDSSSMADALKEVIEKAGHIPGILVELCGSWLWVNGDTRPVKDDLKALGFHFSGSKKAWYWHDPAEKRRRYGKRRYSMDEIRESHGSMQLSFF